MSYVSFPFQENTQFNQGEFEKAPPTSGTLGTVTSFENGLQSLPVAVAANHMMKTYQANMNPGPTLSPEQVKSQYPEMLSKYPKGGLQSDISYDQSLRDRDDMQQGILENMNPGIISGAERLAGSNAAIFGSPLTYLAGGVAEKLGGVIGDPIYRAIFAASQKESQMTAANVAAHIGIGFSKGAATSLPLAISTRDYYHSINQTYSPWNTALMIGMFGVGDAAITTFQGFKAPIDTGDANTIMNKAGMDMAQGKTPDVDPLLKDALYTANVRDVSDIDNPETQLKITQALDDSHKQSQAELEQANNEYDKAVSQNPDAQLDDIKNIKTGPEIIENLKRLKGVPEEYMGDEDKSFMQSLPNNDETKEALTYAMQDANSITPENKSFLDDFVASNDDPKNETMLIKDNLQKAQDLLDKNNAYYKDNNIDLNAPENELKKIQMEALKDEIERKKARLKDLRKLNNLQAGLKKIIDTQKKAIAKEKTLREMKEGTETFFNLKNSSNQPMTREDLQNMVARSNSSVSSADYVGTNVEEPAPEMSDEEEAALSDELNNYVEAQGEGANEYKDDLNEIKRNQKIFDKVQKAIQAYVKCNKLKG